MKPSRTRVSLWPFAALPVAAFFAMAAATASLRRSQGAHRLPWPAKSQNRARRS